MKISRMAKCLVCYQGDVPGGSDYHPACSLKFFGSRTPPELIYTAADMKELAKKLVQSQGIMTGVQPKISLGLERTRRERRRLTLMMGEFILKPPSSHYQQMPETEDLTMHLAEICKIKTVPHALIRLASGELSYITRRIDRHQQTKIHMEDFCQLSGLLTEDKYKSSMEKAGKLVQQFSTFPGLDLVNLFELTVFNYLTGNNDMHLKNFSLIAGDQGWQLSPAYDLLNVNLVNEKDNEESALTVGGEKRKLKKQDLLKLAIGYTLTEIQTRNVFNQLFDKEKEIVSFIKKSFLSKEYRDKYIEILRGRIGILRKG